MDIRGQLPLATALLIGVVCGTGAYAAGLPLPWMLGPMIGNTIAALAGVPLRGPLKLRPYVIPIIGVMLGSGVTAEVLGLLSQWAITLLLLPLFLAIGAGISFVIYRRLGGFDTVTAFYASMPGGLNEMVVLGGDAGGNERSIALAHAARVLLVIIFVALFFGLILGVTSGGRGSPNWTALNALTWADYAILGLCAAAGTRFGRLLRLPAAPIFGPLILSGFAHAMGWVTVAPPTLLVIGAQITMGTIIGTRFVGATLAEVRRDIGLAALATSIMLVIAVIFAEAVAMANGIPLSQAFLAFAPGGLTEMALLTLALEQDVTYVSIMHVIRITMVIAAAPLVFGLTRR